MDELKISKKRVLEAMKEYPKFEVIAKKLWEDAVRKEKKEIDVTPTLQLKWEDGYFMIDDRGIEVSCQANDARINDNGGLVVEFAQPKIGYRFEITTMKNFRVLRKEK